MGLLLYTLLTFLLTNRANGATHWVVTEDGRIQSQMDSVFNLQRPYDLVAMLKQEDRARILEDLKQELLSKKERIDKSEDRDTGLEQRFYRTDPDCIAAGKRLPEFDLYISTVLPLENKGIRPEEHIDFKARPIPHPVSPVCTDMVELHFSMEAFEHLEGVKERHNLTGSPELGLKNAITHRENVDDYGHLVYEALKKNKTSWVLYNMAAFYWRIKGHPYNVVECIRRALHFSPRNYKDVALISLANVLHRARYSNEAAIVVQAALDVSKELNVNHFTLGNIYAVLAEYNKSVICFENTLKIQPDFEAAEKRKHAVLCHAKLEAALEDQHRSLQRTLNDLKEYQQQHEAWQALQEKLQQDQASSDTKFAQRVGYEAYKIRKMASASGENCKIEERDGNQVLECTWSNKGHDDRNGLPHSWKQSPDNTETEKSQPDIKQSSVPADLVYLEPVHPPKYTTKNIVSSHEDSEVKAKDSNGWPSKDECDKFVTKFPAWNEFPTTYLPPENKGFEVKILLTEAQGLTEGMQHSLPWYPPVCNMVTIPDGTEKTYDHLDIVHDRTKHVQKIPDPAMKPILLSLVDGDVTEAEIGQRILTAIKKELGPPWMLYNLAALYWRVIGNTHQGIECLRHSLFFVPVKYRDVPLVNLANVLYKLGQLDDAIAVMKDAVAINDIEPEIHYFLGNILAAKGNLTGATLHYKQVLLQEPEHDEAYASIRTLKCYDKFHRTAQSAAPKQTLSAEDQQDRHTCTKSCSRNGPASCYGNSKQQADSRLICKTVNGHESCVMEMTTPNCDQGHCTQTCTISPLALDNCEGPSGLKCVQAKGASLGNRTPKLMRRMENTRRCCPKRQERQVRGEVKDRFPGQPVADTIYDTFTSLYDKDMNPSASRTADIVDDKNNDGHVHNSDGDHSNDDNYDDGKGHSGDNDNDGDISGKDQRAETKPPSVHTEDGDDDDDDSDSESDDLHQVTDYTEDVTSPYHSEPCHSHDSDHDLPSDSNTGRCPNEIKAPNSCLQTYRLEALTDAASLNPVADPEFYDKMEEVKQYYKDKGLCSGDDCDKYLIQSSQQNPHIKLEVRDGILTQKMIRVDHPDDLIIGPTDCVIFNDGRRSEGCSGEEFQTFDFDEVSNLLSTDEHLSSHGNRPDHQQMSNKVDGKTESKSQKSHSNTKPKHDDSGDGVKQQQGEQQEEDNEVQWDGEEELIFKEDEESELVHFEWTDEEGGERRETNTASEVDDIKQPEKTPAKHNHDKTADKRPDPLRHITKVVDIPWPTWADCRKDFHDYNEYKKITFSQFSSTWVSVSAKNSNIRHLIDFQSKVKHVQKPYCKKLTGKQQRSLFDTIPSLKDISELRYSAEGGLTNMLKILGQETQSVDIIGTRIALAQKQNPDSWELANVAALYWRVEGDAKEALNCLRLGYYQSPEDAKDIALLGIANILYNAGMLDDALAVCDMALDADNRMVATHFTIANIYMTKGDRARARRFYESTLGLQASFHPARERLHYLRCDKVLSNPTLFKDANLQKQKVEL